MVDSDVIQLTYDFQSIIGTIPRTDQHVVKSEIIKCMRKQLKPGPFSSSSSSLGLGTSLDMHIHILLLVTNGELLLEL